MPKPTTVGIYEARTHFCRLVKRAAAGEEIVVANRGRPIARLVGYQAGGRARQPGLLAGKLVIGADFDKLPPVFAGAFAFAAAS